MLQLIKMQPKWLHLFYIFDKLTLMENECMKKALALAKSAGKKGEVPVGAVIVKNGKVIGCGKNKREKSKNAIWHAEMVAINKACKKLKDWRLDGSVMYVTLEPCMMCLGACLNARIKTVVFGAFDPKGEKLKERVVTSLNHNLEVRGGVKEEECSQLLKEFFKSHRK